jgi:methylmalonyl-CoA/ethylmalonyl-CoA epimerase
MAAEPPALHHVVFCVERANQDDAARFWTDLGFELEVIELEDVGLRVLLDWRRGIEVIAPTDPSRSEGLRVRRLFLDDHGQGVYSVVVITGDIDGPLAVAARYGATVELRQDRSGEGFQLEEAMVELVHGMPITFLATDFPS